MVVELDQSTGRSIAPSDEELFSVLKSLRTSNPTLGTAKLHALLTADQPTWSVSEKRTKKALQALGLVLAASTSAKAVQGENASKRYPAYRLNQNLAVEQWSNKVNVRYFDDFKGKGLVATQKISKDEVIWKEDPFIFAAEWDFYDLQNSSAACVHCATPRTPSSPSTPCSSTSGGNAANHCPAHFCNRLCLSRANQAGHALLCPGTNPAAAPLLQFARKNEWIALHALARCAARILCAGARSAGSSLAGPAASKGKSAKEELERDWDIFKGFAVLGMEDRFKWAAEDGLASGNEPDRESWQHAYKLFTRAFREPTSAVEKKRLERLLGTWIKPPSDSTDQVQKQIEEEFFTYNGFLRSLGRMSLNLEGHGGLYTLHSHLNHSCTPNVSVRHLDPRSTLSRITLIAKEDLSPGQELFITYVNPELGVRNRRQRLSEWGFGTCKCDRCMKEEQEDGDEKQGGSIDDLERELKAGLGVL